MFSSLNSDLRKAWNTFIPSKCKGQTAVSCRPAGRSTVKAGNLHLEERSLSRESDHCVISSNDSLQTGVAVSRPHVNHIDFSFLCGLNPLTLCCLGPEMTWGSTLKVCSCLLDKIQPKHGSFFRQHRYDNNNNNNSNSPFFPLLPVGIHVRSLR